MTLDFITIERVLMVVLFACGWLAGWKSGHARGMSDNDGWEDEAKWWRRQNEALAAAEKEAK